MLPSTAGSPWLFRQRPRPSSLRSIRYSPQRKRSRSPNVRFRGNIGSASANRAGRVDHSRNVARRGAGAVPDLPRRRTCAGAARSVAGAVRQRRTITARGARGGPARVVDDVRQQRRRGAAAILGNGGVYDDLPASGWEGFRMAADLGTVRESARVRLNGRDVATLIAPPYQLTLPAGAFDATNVLDVRVTNLSANRIADLDRRGVSWKRFYNVNYPPRFAENRGPDGLLRGEVGTPRLRPGRSGHAPAAGSRIGKRATWHLVRSRSAMFPGR